ncbi:SPFH domain-containing protein [bacterium]|nr:SPFH domain-containing protein [bacterium]
MTIYLSLLALGGGLCVYIAFTCLVSGFYTVKPNERAVISSLGKAVRMPGGSEEPSELQSEDAGLYRYPAVEVVQPGGPYFKWPWQKVHKVSVATQTVALTWDPTKHQDSIEAVTKDNLTTGVNGQIRFKVCENNLYAYLFGVQSPLEHVMGYFVSVLRERIANFEDPKGQSLLAQDGVSEEESSTVEISEGVSINDLRKNLHVLNKYMEEQCVTTAKRYGVQLEAALITEIDPPQEVDRALSAINSTRNQVAADISTAKAEAEQQITMSNRAVEISMNNAQAEVAPLRVLAGTLSEVKARGGAQGLVAYIRNMRVPLLQRSRRIIEVNR